MQRTLNTEAVKGLLSQVQASIPCTGLSQFWGKNSQLPKPNNSSSAPKLWSLVIFSHENVATVSPDMFYKPTAVQWFEYMRSRTLSQGVMWQLLKKLPVDRLTVPSGMLYIMGD